MRGDRGAHVEDGRDRVITARTHPDLLGFRATSGSEQDASVLRRIVEKFGGRMALDCAVVEPGLVSVGDPVELLEK